MLQGYWEGSLEEGAWPEQGGQQGQSQEGKSIS